MARKKTLEELRATNRQRQKRWREAHKWLNRERRKTCYGQSQGQQKSTSTDPVTNNVNEQGYVYDEDPTDARLPHEKAMHEARFAKMKRAVQKASQEPEPDQAAIRQVQAWAEGRRAARKPGVAVPELEY